MKVRAKANGTIIDLPANHGLVRAGLYVPVDEKSAPKPKRKRKPKAK